MLDNATRRRLGRRRGRADDPARAADRPRPRERQGRERLDAAAGSARASYALLLNEDAELRRGRGGADRRARRPTRGPPSPPRSCSRPDGNAAACAWRLPASAPRWPARCSSTACFTVQAGRAHAARSAGPSRARCSCAARRPRRSATSTRDFFVYSDETDFWKRLRRGLAHPLVPGGRADPPRAALDRPGRGEPPDRRVPPQPRPLHAQAPRPRRARCGAGPHRVGLCLGRSRRSFCPAMTPRATVYTPAGAPPRAGRGIREAAREHNARSPERSDRGGRHVAAPEWLEQSAAGAAGPGSSRPGRPGRGRRRGGLADRGKAPEDVSNPNAEFQDTEASRPPRSPPKKASRSARETFVWPTFGYTAARRATSRPT